MNDLSASDYIQQQSTLEEQARVLMPWDPKQCTYELGSLRQQVYACRTHGDIGICYSCSIRCHTSCDIVELFTKRHFTCDCGTEKDTRVYQNKNKAKCEIRGNKENDIAAMDNNYNQNFQGLFCSCAKEYDPDSATVMLQCVLGLECGEDWYHDNCIMGLTVDEAKLVGYEKSETENEPTLKGFPNLDSFDAYVCWKCAAKYDYYFKKILSHELSNEIISINLSHDHAKDESAFEDTKRSREDASNEDQYSVFFKNDYSTGLKKLKESIEDKNDKLYVFLDKIVPFLIDDEDVYEPPQEDENDIYDIVSKSLKESMNRSDLAIGASALNKLQSKLKEFLIPFAQNGKVVKEEDIKSFFKDSKA